MTVNSSVMIHGSAIYIGSSHVIVRRPIDGDVTHTVVYPHFSHLLLSSCEPMGSSAALIMEFIF